MSNYHLGWDIGGAHLKAALLNPQGQIQQVFQQACPLWKGLNELQLAFTQILQQIKLPIESHAITMTGELVDLFDHRYDGVQAILEVVKTALPQSVSIYAGELGFLSVSAINLDNFEAIASANWLATAEFVARKIPQGLFVDIGSTTTDILWLHQGQVMAQGRSAYQRLLSEELVYTGIVRTAIMALTDKAPFRGQSIQLMAEYFATTADIYRLTGELTEAHDVMPSADEAEKTLQGSARRLARMIGCDFINEELSDWQQFAHNLREIQLQKIQKACQRQLSRTDNNQPVTLIGAGIGRFLAKDLATRFKQPYQDFNALLSNTTTTDLQSADCAPAVAVVYLAQP